LENRNSWLCQSKRNSSSTQIIPFPEFIERGQPFQPTAELLLFIIQVFHHSTRTSSQYPTLPTSPHRLPNSKERCIYYVAWEQPAAPAQDGCQRSLSQIWNITPTFTPLLKLRHHQHSRPGLVIPFVERLTLSPHLLPRQYQQYSLISRVSHDPPRGSHHEIPNHWPPNSWPDAVPIDRDV
jgi:hypothetical protein